MTGNDVRIVSTAATEATLCAIETQPARVKSTPGVPANYLSSLSRRVVEILSPAVCRSSTVATTGRIRALVIAEQRKRQAAPIISIRRYPNWRSLERRPDLTRPAEIAADCN